MLSCSVAETDLCVFFFFFYVVVFLHHSILRFFHFTLPPQENHDKYIAYLLNYAYQSSRNTTPRWASVQTNHDSTMQLHTVTGILDRFSLGNHKTNQDLP